MKNFKKYIAALLIFVLALSLCSCSLIDRLKPAPAPETVRLTFPEGTTVIQAAQKLEEGGVCTKDEFISAVNNTERDNKFVKTAKTVVDIYGGYDYGLLDYRVAPHYIEMYNAALEDGIKLSPLSGYRSIAHQKRNFEARISLYMKQGYSKKQATIMASEIILPPQTSEHNAGLCMDILSIYESFENTKEYRWLQAHAADYGFVLRYPKDKQSITNITFEPWHWRYVGVEAAKEMKAKNLCLEEYLGVA